MDSKSVPNDLINFVFPYVVSFMGARQASTGVWFHALFIILMFIITYRLRADPHESVPTGFRSAALREVEYRDQKG